MKNVTAVNNTLYNNNNGVYVRWGSSDSNMVLANNAAYPPGNTAVNAGGSVCAGASVIAELCAGRQQRGARQHAFDRRRQCRRSLRRCAGTGTSGHAAALILTAPRLCFAGSW